MGERGVPAAGRLVASNEKNGENKMRGGTAIKKTKRTTKNSKQQTGRRYIKEEEPKKKKNQTQLINLACKGDTGFSFPRDLSSENEVQAASSKMHHSNGMWWVGGREQAARGSDGKFVKGNGKALANDLGSAVRWLKSQACEGLGYANPNTIQA